MISIITCTTDLSKAQKLYHNIAETIGEDFEFLPFDNAQRKLGLCQVYNRQAKLAKGEIICFVHDDVRFLTQGWGKVLHYTFNEQSDVGLVGVSGSAYKTELPSMWTTAPQKFLASNIIQHYKYSDRPKEHILWKYTSKVQAEVVTVDGVFLATTQKVWTLHPFDEKTFDGFHCYDMDFSFQVLTTHRVLVTYQILLEHFSEGNADREWFKAAKNISKKWKDILPISHYPLSKMEEDRLEYAAMFAGLTSIDRSSGWRCMKKTVYFFHCFRTSFLIMPFVKKRIDKHLMNLPPI